MLYDALHSKYTYKLLGGEARFMGYAQFSRIYQERRSHISSHFKRLWDEYFMQIAFSYGLVFAASLVLFWKVWWLFAGPFALVQLVALIYQRFHLHYGPAFVACGLISVMLEQDSL